MLITATSVSETASRNPASSPAVAFAALSRALEGNRTTRRAAAGATVCTISVSWTSSSAACHGEPAPASVVTTWIRAAGSRNVPSKAVRSWRISLAGVTPGGGAAVELLAGAPRAGATARTVTVSPRPSIPLSGEGWMPF